MRGAPPPPVIRPPNAAADYQFVGAQLYNIYTSMQQIQRNFCREQAIKDFLRADVLNLHLSHVGER